MEFLGYLSAVAIGISLGLLGGGGSILTVPALVYLMGISPVPATAYSLFVVGLTSLVGSLNYFKKDLISLRTAFIFGVPSLISVFITRMYILPAIPENLLSVHNFIITKDIAVMILFAVLMVIASASMIKNRIPSAVDQIQKLNYTLISVEGFIVGIFTGLLGAGGGFLIIPALVIFARLPMKVAVGTSLLIIAIKSLIGFTGDLMGTYQFDWILLGGFSAFAVTGIFIGSYFSDLVSDTKLKPAFGWFILFMGIYIIIKELLNNT